VSEEGGIPMSAVDEIDAMGGDEELERWLVSRSSQPA
jgi:hypothetical protein